SIDGLVSAVVSSRVIKRLIHQYKHAPYVSDLRDEIGQLMCESLEHNELFYAILKKSPIFISVPLYRGRLQKRGYNHASLLCSYVAQYFKQKMMHNVIIQIRDTKPQYMLAKSEHSTNVYNAFELNESMKKEITGKTVVVVDDVVNTCSTLREISKVLKCHGAKEVWGVVFARKETRKA
ncbi:MAG TPA: phosphoribosyltransferase family protein, partial [Candidatus Levybacteria bacterium]|nr:phosphoribosyltransferase family protein [Candidatus Levybacteria bacterium]